MRPFILVSLVVASLAQAQNADEMARQVASPIASLASVPVQFNDEYDAGVNGAGHRLRINVQPVIPLSIDGRRLDGERLDVRRAVSH